VSAEIQAIDEGDTGAFEEAARLVRGVLFGAAFSLPLWGAIIAVARMAF
jgi:hypothetical protein